MQFIFPESEPIRARPWTKKHPPEKVLFIRFHAFGDLLIAMLAVQALKQQLPEAEFHLLVGGPFAEVPQNMSIFTKVHTLKHARGGWPMALDLLGLFPSLMLEGYDAIVDLQNHRISQLARRLLFPDAWSQFDRYSKIHALLRFQNTVNALGLEPVHTFSKIDLLDKEAGLEKLWAKGWNGSDLLVLLNPCGAFSTRQWGEDKYLAFAQSWLAAVDSGTKFVLLGYPSLRDRTRNLVQMLGASCFDLIGETTTKEVFNLVRSMNLTLSDDGALMHSSWVNQVPTIAFLGASPSYWGVPLGPKSFAFTSADLPCGDCHRTECIWGDHRCLTRVTPDQVVQQARTLLGL